MKILVTGGGGFLGGAIVRLLLNRGDKVRNFSRSDYPELKELGVELHRGDIADAKAVNQAAKGCDIVFHVAAKTGIWGPYEEYYRCNVLGTKNVIETCHKHKIRRLVYTSSPSVVFDGKDMESADESVPYPTHYEAHYPKTKAMAEQEILKANGKDLATVVLRPHLIWGPADQQLVPRIIARGKAGHLKKIGTRPNRVDSIYIDNAARAHILAADRLKTGSPIAGKIYFISQGDPLPVWDLINKILEAGGVPSVTQSISPQLAYIVGWFLELVYRVFHLSGEPRMTRFLARELSTAHWFDISAARRDLGYKPTITIDEGMKRLAQSLCE